MTIAALVSSLGPAAGVAGRLPGPTAVGGFSFSVGRKAGDVVITGRGHLNAGHGAQLRAVLSDLIEGQGNRVVVLDLGGVSNLDRTAVKVVTAAADSAHRRGAKLILANLNDDTRATIRASRPAATSPSPKQLVG